jgi:hypothetical protein
VAQGRRVFIDMGHVDVERLGSSLPQLRGVTCHRALHGILPSLFAFWHPAVAAPTVLKIVASSDDPVKAILESMGVVPLMRIQVVDRDGTYRLLWKASDSSAILAGYRDVQCEHTLEAMRGGGSEWIKRAHMDSKNRLAGTCRIAF